MKGVSNMVGRLTVDETRCTGCMGCVLACSFAKEGVFSLALSRIVVLRDVCNVQSTHVSKFVR